MTACPLDPERRRKPLYAAVALVLAMAAVLLAVGCVGKDYVPDHDIIVIKQSSDGSLEWTKTIDEGGDDKASILVPASDGGVIIPVNYNRLIRFSDEGELVWEKNYTDPFCMGDALTQLRDGDFIWISSGYSIACKIDRNGNLVWNKSPIKFDQLESSSVDSVIELHNRDFIAGGNSLSRLNPEGELFWSQSEATNGFGRIFSVIEMSDREDILGLSQKNGLLYLLRMDLNGIIITNSSLGIFDGYPSPSIKSDKNGYSILFFNTSSSMMETVHLDPEGKTINSMTLMNATVPTIMTDDGGYLSGIIQNIDNTSGIFSNDRKIMVGVNKLDADGFVVWTMTPVTFCKPESTINIQIKNVVQTSDGGYVILGLRDNFWKC